MEIAELFDSKHNRDPLFTLYNKIPVMSTDDSVLFFNFNKRLMAAVPRCQNYQDHLKILKKENFFDVSVSLTPGESRDQFDIILIPTIACSMKCRYCYLGDKPVTQSDLEPWAAIAFIDRLVDMNPKKDIFINFFGGEPTMNPQLIRHVTEHIRGLRSKYPGKNFLPGISTNGAMGGDFLDYLLENDYYFSLSIDGPPAVQDQFRPLKNGAPSSGIVQRNLEKIASTTGKLRARVTITESNVHQMESILRYLANFGVKVIQLEIVNIYERIDVSRKGINRPTVEDFSKQYIKALKLARQLGVFVATTCYHKILFPSRYMCEGISGQRVVIAPSGIITRCSEVQHFDHPLADLLKVGRVDFSRKEVSFSRQWLKERKMVVPGENKSSEECEDCFAYYTCSNGCLSHNYQTMGDAFIVDEFYCKTTRDIVKYLFDRIYEETARWNPPKDPGNHSLHIVKMFVPPEFVLYDQSANQIIEQSTVHHTPSKANV
jgi:uncharacterized protein